MDAARYARIRDLFLAAEELPADDQVAFVRDQAGQDAELYDEVVSLLAEHDAECAKREGESAIPLPPLGPSIAASVTQAPSSVAGGGPTTQTETKAKTKPSAANTAKTTARVGSGGATKTKAGAGRTHASPRHQDNGRKKPASTTTGNALWAHRRRQSQRRNSGWLWLAALLPTALIGWWTYRQVESMIRQSIQTELVGVVDSVAISADRFLNDKSELVLSWSRQPSLVEAIEELNFLVDERIAVEELRTAPQIDRIGEQLKEMSGNPDIKYVVWDDSYRTIASWTPDRMDVGTSVHPSGAANLARAMAGQTVVFGPQRLGRIEGFEPETDAPVMAVIVPIKKSSGQVIAAMLVRGLSINADFNQIFDDSTSAGQIDSYAINRDGVMLTDSVRAKRLAMQHRLDVGPDDIAASFRVADPGRTIDASNAASIRRQVRPITIAAAGAMGQPPLGRSFDDGSPNLQIEPYNNYAGESVVGAWRWLPRWEMGVIVEKTSDLAFAPARVVRFSFVLLGSVLSLTAFLAATKIAKTSTDEHAAIHPLSRYEIMEPLGSGGMGVVFRAHHKQLGRDAAMKVLRGDRQNKEDRLRFDREARLAASLSNPHCVQIYDYGYSDEGEAFCVMQFLKGLTLHEVVARSGHQPIGRTLFILRQVCDALAEAHSLDLLHRDVKPQNIMLSLDPSVGDWAVMFDFGLAKPLQPDTSVYQTSETIWSGTPMYMAPERFRQPGVMDPRSDIYSVGCIAYYLLSGRPPFIESDPESLFALILTEHPIGIRIHRGEDVPAEINEWIAKCMAKRADDRFRTIEEASRVLDQLRVAHPWSVDEARVWWDIHGSD
jgi:eukaryotic-like serine/threonine-protein kinase